MWALSRFTAIFTRETEGYRARDEAKLFLNRADYESSSSQWRLAIRVFSRFHGSRAINYFEFPRCSVIFCKNEATGRLCETRVESTKALVRVEGNHDRNGGVDEADHMLHPDQRWIPAYAVTMQRSLQIDRREI